MQPLVPCPKGGALGQSRGSEKVRIDVSNAEPEQPVFSDEVQRFLMRGDD